MNEEYFKDENVAKLIKFREKILKFANKIFYKITNSLYWIFLKNFIF